LFLLLKEIARSIAGAQVIPSQTLSRQAGHPIFTWLGGDN